MYAVIQTGGKQYKVQVGDVLYVEKLSAEADDVVKFDTVLAFEDENGIQVGTPTLDIPVEAKVLKNGKAKKIVFIVEMLVKGSASYFSTKTKLVYRDILKAFFVNQLEKCRKQSFFSFFNS